MQRLMQALKLQEGWRTKQRVCSVPDGPPLVGTADGFIAVEEENQVKWMSEFNFSGRQNFLQKKRTGDTGIWLLDSQEYTDWMVTPGDLLWLPGICK